MTKKEFMQRLKQLLPEKDKRDILLDYEEHFLSGLTEGKTEEEIVAELGTPEEVAREYGYAEKDSLKGNALAGVGLIFLDILIVIGPLVGLAITWLLLWLIPIVLLIIALTLIVVSFVALPVILPWYLTATLGVALLAFSVLFGIGMYYLSKGCGIALKWYYNLHVRAFNGN